MRPAETNHENAVHTDVHGPYIHHAEAETDEDGRVVFGIRSHESSFQTMYSVNEFDDTTVQAWVDLQNDDLLTKDEPARLAWIHWELPGRCTHVGGIFDDILSGTREDDKLCGQEGIDEIFAQEGADIILGGMGADFILGDPGNDLIYGETDDDMISGGLGDDAVHAGRGNDTLKGWRGNDVLNGRVGDDVLYGGRGDDTLNGGPGFDKCFGDLGEDTFEKCERVRDKKPPPRPPKGVA
jgi:Ca2+-binding RTX toxin-like protein